jgi:hypothetical protein
MLAIQFTSDALPTMSDSREDNDLHEAVVSSLLTLADVVSSDSFTVREVVGDRDDLLAVYDGHDRELVLSQRGAARLRGERVS